MNRSHIALVTAGAVYIGMLFGSVMFATKAHRFSVQSQGHLQETVTMLSMSERISDLGRNLWSSLVGSQRNPRQEALETSMRQAELTRDAAWQFSRMAIGALVGAILTVALASRLSPLPLLPIGTQILALICLGFGLVIPVMTVLALQNFPVIGPVVFKFQSKSILQTIVLLWDSARVVAIMIFLFSVLNPILKTVVTLLVTLSQRTGQSHFGHFILKHLGKWSMADVFIVAILLSWFAMQSDPSTTAQLEPGILFFGAFCMLSVASGYIVKTQKPFSPDNS